MVKTIKPVSLLGQKLCDVNTRKKTENIYCDSGEGDAHTIQKETT